MKKKILGIILAVLAVIIFVLLPFPAADLHIRVEFEPLEGDYCLLYYSTDPSGAISPDSYLKAEIDENHQVDFRLDSELEGKITSLRLDFPDVDQLVCVRNVSMSSAGIIQKEWNPCIFFGPDNLVVQNGIDGMSLVWVKKSAYFKTSASDPHVYLSEGLVRSIQDSYSHFRLTRLLICVFMLSCVWSWKKGPFAKASQEGL